MNAVYATAKQKILQGQVNWLTDTIVSILVDTTKYTYSDFHSTLLDVPTVARISTSGNLTGRTVGLYGVADADDTSFGTVVGNQIGAAILVQNSGTDATSNLIAYYDQAAGLPLNPNGDVIVVAWSSGSNHVFSLA